MVPLWRTCGVLQRWLCAGQEACAIGRALGAPGAWGGPQNTKCHPTGSVPKRISLGDPVVQLW